MELGKSATLHSAYSVHFFLIQVISAKFNTARRTKKIGEKANGAGTHLSASLRNPGPVAGFLLHSRCVKTSNSSRARRSHHNPTPLAVNQQQSSPTRRRPMSAATSISLAVADAIWDEIKSAGRASDEHLSM